MHVCHDKTNTANTRLHRGTDMNLFGLCFISEKFRHLTWRALNVHPPHWSRASTMRNFWPLITLCLISTIHPRRQKSSAIFKVLFCELCQSCQPLPSHLWLLMRFTWKLCFHWRRNDSQASSWLALCRAVVQKRHLSDGRSHLLSILVLSSSADYWWWWFLNNRSLAGDEKVTACIK